MKKIKFIFLHIFCVLSIFSLEGCSMISTTNNDIDNYKFGVVYTSINKNNSVISTYDSQGTHILDENIDAGGITLASFMKFGIDNGKKIYFPLPVLGNKPQDYIIELDKENFKYKQIKNVNSKTPTFFTVDTTFAYLGTSSIDTTFLSKVSLKTNECDKSIELDGQGIFLLEHGENIYIASIIHDEDKPSYGRIYTVSKSDLSILDAVNIDDVSFITDITVVNGEMYILVDRDGNDDLSDKLITLNLDNKNLDNKNIDIIRIPFKNLNKLYTINDELYVIQGSYNLDETDNNIAKINLNTKNIEVFQTENSHISSLVYNNEFYSSDGDFIYLYDLTNLTLKNKFKLNSYNDEIFVSFFIKS